MKLSKEYLQSLPSSPGCYIYKDKYGKVLYVGKAVNIRARVGSYFSSDRSLPSKIQLMLKQAVKIEIITVDSEVEALILETNLIKKYRPKYNRLMKDDKNYVWVMFDNTRAFAKPEIVREKRVPKATYFGPYPQKFPAAKVLRRLRRLFPYCNTSFKTTVIQRGTKKQHIGREARPCLDYHLGLCSGVCAGLASQTEHRRNVNNIKRFFRGEKMSIYQNLEKRMKKLAAQKNFEEAGKIRDQLSDLEYVTQRIRIDNTTDDDNFLKKKLSTNHQAIEQLGQKLKIDLFQEKIKTKDLNTIRIECYDISNIQGSNATGSMVVFVGGRPAKDHYRKFKIRLKTTPDDFAMMQEVLTRRFGRKPSQDLSFREIPDLIIIDGGKGQLSSAYEILGGLSIIKSVSIVGLAKKQEEIFKIAEGEFKRIVLPRRSNALYLVQRIRDEAHRFAIGYHRLLRSKSSTKSRLDDVPGIGNVTKKRLLLAFGSLEGIKKASEKDLATVVRNRRTVNAILKLRSEL